LAGLEIQQVLPRTGRGPRKALVWGWPFMREAKQEKIHLGWPTKTSLCKVAKGERPLSCALWKATGEYVART